MPMRESTRRAIEKQYGPIAEIFGIMEMVWTPPSLRGVVEAAGLGALPKPGV